MKMMILIVQMTLQTISFMHSKTPVCSGEEMWISFFELAENTAQLILDENSNEDSLTMQGMK
jgi:hypothetical protein